MIFAKNFEGLPRRRISAVEFCHTVLAGCHYQLPKCSQG
jgi:hypothetical protein